MSHMTLKVKANQIFFLNQNCWRGDDEEKKQRSAICKYPKGKVFYLSFGCPKKAVKMKDLADVATVGKEQLPRGSRALLSSQQSVLSILSATSYHDIDNPSLSTRPSIPSHPSIHQSHQVHY